MNRPNLYTLEGWPGSGFGVRYNVPLRGSYVQYDTYRNQDLQVIQGYDLMGKTWLGRQLEYVWKPDKLKKTAGALAVVAGTAAAVFPGGQFATAALWTAGASALVAGGAKTVHQITKDDGGQAGPVPGTGYDPVKKPPPPPEEAKIPWTPIAVGIGGLLAALALS